MLEGTQRTTFMENLGRQYAGQGYYANRSVAFTKALTFKPFASLKMGTPDMAAFFRGFDEVQKVRELVMILKAKAQLDNHFILRELEGKGLTFLQERVKSYYD